MNKHLRTISTARTVQDINTAANAGYWPLVKAITPSTEIRAKFAVLQNNSTGEINVIGDFRADVEAAEVTKVIDFTFYYPHHFENPFAAYLIPSDIEIGEHVWLTDLIEDVVGHKWNQGDSFRLASCEAIWNGKEFILQEVTTTMPTFIG